MNEETTTTAQSLDSIVELLSRYHQRATYGAVAKLLGRSPRSLMQGRSRSAADSWIVAGSNGVPTGYEEDQMAPDLKSRATILRSPKELSAWLASPG